MNLFLPILRLDYVMLLGVPLLDSSAWFRLRHAVYGLDSRGWFADTVFMVGLGIIFRRIAPVRAITEWIQRVMVAWGV